MRQEFYEHKKSDRLKWIATFIAFLLLAGIAGMFALGAKKSGWFEQPKEPLKQESSSGSVIDGEGNELKEGEVYKMPTRMTFTGGKNSVSSMSAGYGTQTEQSVTLTATITPASAVNQNVTWEAAFTNPASAWAKGKSVSDYVTVTPESDGSATATVKCKAAFGEQIKIIAGIKNSATVKAECTVDFEKRLLWVTAKLTGANGTGTLDTRQSAFEYNGRIEDTLRASEVTPEYSAYTVDHTYTLGFTGQYVPGTDNKLREELNAGTGWTLSSPPVGTEAIPSFWTQTHVISAASAPEDYNKLVDWCKAQTEPFYQVVVFDKSAGNAVIKTLKMSYNKNSISGYYATGIALNDSDLVF